MMWIIPILESSRSSMSKLTVWRERWKAVLERLWVFEPGSFKRICYLYHKCINICDCMVSSLSPSWEIIQCSTIPNRRHTSLPLSLSLSVAVEREQQVGGEISLIPLSHMTENESYLIIWIIFSPLLHSPPLSLLSLNRSLSLWQSLSLLSSISL